MKPSPTCFLIPILIFGAVGCSKQGPSDQEISWHWVTVFDESFADNPHQRFRMLPVTVPGASSAEGSGGYDQLRRVYSLGGYLSLLRPVHGGAHVEWLLKLRFLPPKAEDPQELETDLMLVLANQTMAGIEMRRSKATNAATVVRFVHQQSDELPVKVLREMRVPTIPVEGTWMLRYRHGLLTLVQGTNTLGSADLKFLGVPVIGVSWIQKGGAVECARMTLTGEPPREVSIADQESVLQASRLNQEAAGLLRDKRPKEALVKMEEASALYLKVHGELHHDSANSLGNRATILEAMGRTDEAGKLWAKALDIHEKTLGVSHPHTTRTRFSWGNNCFAQGDVTRARELWARCRDEWRRVLGVDDPQAEQMGDVLRTLPRSSQAARPPRKQESDLPPPQSPDELTQLRAKADKGDAEGQLALGDAYRSGRMGKVDFAEAGKWYRKAAEQGHVGAQYNLGVMYANGHGVPQDKAEAVRWYRKAAEQGFAGAQINLACCYEAAQGVAQDYAEALKWYRKAAEQGEAIAHYNIGGMYYRGQGVPQDYTQAVKCFRMAAEQGNAMAQCNLGVCYYKGQGVTKDVVEAYAWLSLAAGRIENAANNCAVFEKKMSPQQLIDARKRANELRALIEDRLNRRTP